MKKVLVLMLLLLTAPAMAAVTITLTENPAESGIVEVSYSCSDADLPRAFGLDVTVSGACEITGVTNVNSNFRVYPTAIKNDPAGKIGGSPVVGSLPSGAGGSISLEMSTLYGVGDPCGFVNPPAASGLLCKIVTGGTVNSFGITNGYGQVTVSENTQRGGVVMENYLLDPGDNLPQTTWAGQPCLSGGDLPAGVWQAWGAPECWCYKKQCRGDTDGNRLLNRPVYGVDLATFRDAFAKFDAQLQLVPNGICADLDHAPLLNRRVYGADLATFRNYFAKFYTLVPDCPNTNINFWTNLM